MFQKSILCTAILGAGLWVSAMTVTAESMKPTPSPEDLAYFESNVRPVLSQYCYDCHGAESQKGGLRLDHIQTILSGGDSGPALVAGKVAESRLATAIAYDNVDLQMPPKGMLPQEARDALVAWIERGAPWPDEPLPELRGAVETFDLEKRREEHWAWHPITDPAPPEVTEPRFQKHPVDRFLQAPREAQGLQTVPTADRAVLVRRAYFALTGLPPTPEAVDAFIQDSAPDAYSRLLDSLLDDPAFGERWARHWFDLVRYADTHGHEGDYPIRHAWTYRDYVIRAFNDDIPYDQFVREHIAGDLFEQPRRNPEEGYNESELATGFWFMHQATHAPVDVLRDQADRIDNQLDVMSKTFLGMTLSCSRCHDHKFDAISAKDYYAMAGYMYSARQSVAFLDPGQKIQSGVYSHKALLRQQEQTLLETIQGTPAVGDRPIAPYLQAAAKVVFDAPKPSDGVAEMEAAKQRDPKAEALRGRPVDKVAEETGLDTGILTRWVAALSEQNVQSQAHPLHAWHALSSAARRMNTRQFLEQAAHIEGQSTSDSGDESRNDVVYADFDSDSYGDWFNSGDAFGARPTQADAWEAVHDELRLTPAGVAHSGIVSGKLQGILRSQTFTIDCDFIHFRVAGNDAQIRLVIDGYQLTPFNGLLFGDTLIHTGNTGGAFVWKSMGKQVGKYRGQRAYIELIDESDGYIAVDKIVMSNSPTPPDELGFSETVDLLPRDIAHKSMYLDALATRYESAFQAAWARSAGTASALISDPLTALLIRHGLWWPEDKIGVREALRITLRESNDRIAAPVKGLVMTSGTPENALYYIRGDHKNPGEPVERDFMTALDTGDKSPTPNRLALAEKMVDPANPLTARVYVNRIWHHLFGRGIVPSVDNFGVLGQLPTHPELLDYLATRFMAEGWSTKALIKFLMETETYQLGSAPLNPAAEQADPANIYLHRMPVRRLEGEAIRDSLLAVAGNLDATMYGPAVQAYVAPFEANRRSPASGPLDGNRRRTVYLEVRRNHLLPMVAAFDMPIPDTTIGNRTISNLPAQALIMMNAPFVIDQARVWGERVLGSDPADFSDLVNTIYRSALARSPRADEQAALEAFVTTQASLYGLPEDTAWKDARVLADLCHTVFMLKEFIYIG